MLAIWGAITGTLGLILSGYLAWVELNRRMRIDWNIVPVDEIREFTQLDIALRNRSRSRFYLESATLFIRNGRHEYVIVGRCSEFYPGKESYIEPSDSGWLYFHIEPIKDFFDKFSDEKVIDLALEVKSRAGHTYRWKAPKRLQKKIRFEIDLYRNQIEYANSFFKTG